MNRKIIGIFILMLMIGILIVPVSGRIIFYNDASATDDNLQTDNTQLKWMIAGNSLRFIRSYWIHVPPSYDGSENVPLVIVLHGSTGFSLKYPFSFLRSSWIEDYTKFSMKADQKGFIVVYPNAKFDFYTNGYDYNYGGGYNGPPKYVDDIGFLYALINKMEMDYNINSSRIYITGISDGGFFSYSAGSILSDIVAAIAPVAGAISAGFDDDFYRIPNPENPVSVIVFHGTNDSLTPYEGGGDYNISSVNESIAFWVEQNGCELTPEIYTSPSGKIIRRTYRNGEKGTDVIIYTTVGGGHWWPGTPWASRPGAPWLIDTIQEISATDLIWDFFESHPKQ